MTRTSSNERTKIINRTVTRIYRIMPGVYCNEIDRHAAYWLSRLPGHFETIDERSIKNVEPHEVSNYQQCHFFAGIGGWPLALQLAGWPEDIPVWTGSCPCQPFSSAGKGKGEDDERHLWPEFRRLIDGCRPPIIFGEQVASKAGRDWLSSVRVDLEAMGYEVGAADLCAASVGAPHIRQRLFWVAHANGRQSRKAGAIQRSGEHGFQPKGCRPSGMGDANSEQNVSTKQGQLVSSEGCNSVLGRRTASEQSGTSRMETKRLASGSSSGLEERQEQPTRQELTTIERSRNAWERVEYTPCRDGKARPVKPGVRVLAHGIPGRVAQLRGLGNAIVPQVAAVFVRCFMDYLGISTN